MDFRYTELAVTVHEARTVARPEGSLLVRTREPMACGDCTDCTGCSACTGCSDCTDCSGCTGCSDCTDCSSCTNCSVASITPGCPQCGTNCTKCTGTGTLGCSEAIDQVTDDDLEILRATLRSTQA